MEKPEKNWISTFYFLARPKNGLNGKFKIRTTAKDGSTIEHEHKQLWKPGTATDSKQQFTKNGHMPSSNRNISKIGSQYDKQKKILADNEEKRKKDESNKAKNNKQPNLKKADCFKKKEKQPTNEKMNATIKSELLPLYAYGCNGDDSKCGDLNGHRLVCSTFGMCECAGEACRKRLPYPSKENKAIQYEKCSVSKPCIGHGQKCNTSNTNQSCHKVQEKLHCFRNKYGNFGQCFTKTECYGRSNFDCANVII